MKYLPHYHGPMDRDIPWEFGWDAPYWCERCKGLEDRPELVTLARRTLEDEGEDAWVCPECGGIDVSEQTGKPSPFRAIRRRRIHSNHLETAA